jgi:hypothetical protein
LSCAEDSTKKIARNYKKGIAPRADCVYKKYISKGDTPMTTQTKILGYEGQTNCDCCGRHLKIGINLAGLGTFGADCIRAAMPVDRKIYSQGRPDAAWLRTLAKIAERDSAERIAQMGYTRAMLLSVDTAKLIKQTA